MEENKETKSTEEIKPKQRNITKRVLKVLLYIALIIIGLNVLLYALLSIPYIQQKVADFAVSQLKNTLKTEVSIDEVRLSLFNRVSLKGIYIEDQTKDTLLYAKDLNGTLSPWELIKNKELAITSITLEDFVINVNQKDSISDFNFQFIIDAFSSTDTTQTDTTKSSLNIVIKDIGLKHGRLNYDVLSDTITPGIFNASHISLTDFNANLDLNSIDTDRLNIALNNLSVKEKSGIEITSLKGHLYSEKDQLWVDNLSFDLPQSHLRTNKVRYNLASNEFEIATEDTEISPLDAVAFLPNLKFLKNNIKLNTTITGTLPKIDIKDINLTYGEDFYLTGKASIASYEQYGNSEIFLSIDKFKATPAAITSFARLGDSTFIAPDILKDLGDIYLKGKLTGRLNKFKLDAETWCRHGSLNLLATGAVDTTFTNFKVDAGLKTQGFSLGKLLGEDTGLGRLTANINLRATQSERTPLEAQVKGNLTSLQYDKETLTNVPLEAYYNSKEMGVSAKANWAIGKITAIASMTQEKVPDIKVRLRVDTLHIDHFYKNENWIEPRLSLSLNGNIKGLDIDNMVGFVNIDSLDLHDATFSFTPGKFSLESGKKENNDKYIDFESSLLRANITGQYSFTSLPEEIDELMHNYLPAVFPQIKKSWIRQNKNKNDFTFNITANNTEELGRILQLPVDVIVPATIDGSINTIEKTARLQGKIPHIRYGEYNIRNTILDMANADTSFYAQANAQVFMDKGRYKLSLLLDGAKDNITTRADIQSDSTAIKIDGRLEALAQFSRNEEKELVSSLKVNPSKIKVGKLSVNLLPAQILNVGSRTEVHDFGLGVNTKPYFGIDGVISDQKTDSLKAYFSHAEIGDLLEAFDIKNIRGCIHGDILLTNLLEQPEVYTKGLEMADIVIFGDTLGTMRMESQWSDYFGGAELNATLLKGDKELAEIDGTVYTNQDSLDLQLRLDQMPMGWMQPFVSDMVNKISGSVSTNIMIEGSTKAPLLRGFIGFNNTQIGIDYTNVLYTISDTISISPDRIGFENLALKDSYGNTANVSATVTHKNFEQMKYSLNMQMNKLMVLNTEHRTDSLFYGRVFASGNVRIEGDDNAVNMNMQIKNEKNSSLNILLPQRAEATDYKSVVYINVPEEKLQQELANALKQQVYTPLPINLKVKLDITPDFTVGVIIDPITGDAMQAKGSGTVNFSYDLMTENMSTFGDYTISSGKVKLNLQSIKKLEFQIREGSKLKFVGDPLKTQFDITAYHRVRANLTTLDNSFELDDIASPRVDVDCVLGIAGNMDKMELTYNISLPDASDDVQRKVSSLITTDEQKIKQFAYLIAAGSFYSESGGNTGNFGQSIWTSFASGQMSKVLNNLVGNVLGEGWEVGTNIESNDGTLSDMDVRVNVSKRFFDDRLKIKTDVGYRADQTNSDNLIGDFDVEYQLNSMWTLRGYSHTNDKYYRQALTTQGIGIVYSKEAATLKRLFQSFKPRRRNRNAESQSQAPAKQEDNTKTDIQKQPAVNEEKKK
ncbi:translocation/assembly module TamB domain-containing protein [Dysgonomonas sp. BGC7]|uniref:translocation/assembly module TamB domain-containing protein n=1 Tax=Dysgonomonas sp. BGC7 TaxID=1658008 RepID=UPI0006808C2C|nr:translocation/assembly module TamB domain-containing protein [Dysgonomonas sp. BGC7]MBD8387513.1 translocation/assembly module TamB domain-containing protein [Dysgonomonas sp. BGC7]